MPSRPRPKLLFSVAQRLRESLMQPCKRPDIVLPEFVWNDLCALAARLAFVERRRWSTAAAHVLDRFDRTAEQLMRELRVHIHNDRSATPVDEILSLRDIYDELVALHQEFNEVRINLREQRLSVVTEPIVLEDVELGRFEIALQLNKLGGSGRLPYQVVALDPNPSPQDYETTHPHVNCNALCAGDGSAPIRNALRQGRIWDFFVLVRQVLETYNSGSAYAQLSHWNGCKCACCGETASEDDSITCERCQEDTCMDCTCSCCVCHRSCCDNCRKTCKSCHEETCLTCSRTCAECDDKYCSKCLTQACCRSCTNQPQENSDALEKSIEESHEVPPASPALQPVRVGQAVVPA